MTRVYLPLQSWPQLDRQAWATAIAKGSVLGGRGLAYDWRPPTRRTNIEHYSRWLAFLLANRHTLEIAPAKRVTKDGVKAYLAELDKRIAPRTVASSLIGLKAMMKVMAPEVDWIWLADICNRLNRTAKPSIDKRPRLLDSSVIYRKALRHLDKLAKSDLTKRRHLVGYRNGLMVALMAAHPLRRRNFSGLTIGTTIRRVGEGWLIDIPAAETKNSQPIKFDVSDRLTPYLETYLDRVRSKIAKGSETALWVSWDGDRMGDHSVYITFTHITLELFGKSINPHLFRDCAATTLASHSSKAAMAAPGLLGHLRSSTTEKHYIHARQLEASRKMNDLLTGLTNNRDGISR